MGHLRGGALDAGGAVDAMATGGVEFFSGPRVVGCLRLIESAVAVEGRGIAGVGIGSGGGGANAVPPIQAGVVGLRDHVRILHGRLWPHSHRHGCGMGGKGMLLRGEDMQVRLGEDKEDKGSESDKEKERNM